MQSHHADSIFPNTDGLPVAPLEGEVCEQYIRCGKPGCRCQSGQLHGPYHYRIWREGAHVRKVYVKAAELDAVRAACEAHKRLSRSLKDVKHSRLRLAQSISREWRRTQRFLDK
jgi:hypothetical protein